MRYKEKKTEANPATVGPNSLCIRPHSSIQPMDQLSNQDMSAGLRYGAGGAERHKERFEREMNNQMEPSSDVTKRRISQANLSFNNS